MVTETQAEYGTEPLIERLRRATIGRYDVYAELGSGGMASVFLALDLALERKVAIKVMSPALASSGDAIERFRREARVAAALSHPNIIGIYAVGDDPELAFYVMKFIEGRSLDSVLREEGRQGIPFTQAIVQYAGNALAYAHTRGVVHRDVKPANFMLDMDGWLVVTDFGIAKMEDAKGLTMSGTLVGTPYYMSPEQFNGSAVTGASDQYALGIVAYEMLTGETPFHASTLGEVMKGHLLDAPPPIRSKRPDVPVEMEACINRMLAKKPEERFPTLADAVTAFGSIHPAEEKQVRTQIITLAKSGALLQPRMSVPASPMPTRSPARPPQQRRSVTPPVPAPVVAPRSGRGGVALTVFLTLLVTAGGLYAWRPELFTRAAALPEAPVVSAPAPIATPGAGLASADSTAALTPPAQAAATRPDSSPSTVSTATQAAAPAPTPQRAPARSAPERTTTRPQTATADAQAESPPPATRETQRPTPATPAPRQQPAPPTAVDTAPPAPAQGSVDLRANVPGSVLYIDGQLHGIIGGKGRLTIPMAAGVRRLRIQAEGCVSWEDSVTVVAGQTVRLGNRNPTCN